MAKAARQVVAPEVQMSAPGEMRPAAVSADYTKMREHLDQRMSSLVTDRLSWWAHWQEIGKYLLPRRYKWLITPNQANRGSNINQAIIDNTATMALRVLAAGMMAGITSPGRPWFRLTLDDPDRAKFPAVRAWLDEVASRLRTIFAESNFYTSLGTVYEDLGSFGTGAMVMYEDYDDVLRCYNSCLGEYCLANSPRMAVDTFYRQFVMTTGQVAKMFGVENCSPTIQQAVQQKGAMLAREVIVAHSIEPNDEMVEGARGIRGMPIRECYWEWGSTTKSLLRVRGFHESPLIAPRWSIVGNDAYGRSPGMDALGDVKQLQLEQKRKAQAIDKMVNPPMVADVALKNEPASLLPGGVTYVQNTSQAGFKPAYEVKPELQHMVADLQDVRERINRAFFVDLFQMISSLEKVRTATEIDARREEKLILLGPVLERFENEALDPAINRAFNIALRAGLLPPVPEELRGQHIKTEYISMLAQAQQAAMTIGLERFATFVARVAAGQAGVQGVGPEAMDKVDWDEMVDRYGDALGVNAKIIRSLQEVMKIREARNAAAEQQKMAADASAMIQGAEVLSNTNVGGGANALQEMIS